MKTSLGIWALSGMVTRFVPGGYQPEHAKDSTVVKVRRAVEGLGDLMDDYEFHYPKELSRETSTTSGRRSTATASTPSRGAAPRPAFRQGRPLVARRHGACRGVRLSCEAADLAGESAPR